MEYQVQNGGREHQQLLRICWLYYMEGLTHKDIADRLGLSRIKVTRLLQHARNTGVVQIKISGINTQYFRLEQALCEAFNLRDVVVVMEAEPGPPLYRVLAQLRGEVPVLFDPVEPMKLNQARVLSVGSDITLFSSGICTEEAMRATRVLAERGVSIQHMHISTHKPFNDPSVLQAAAQAKYGTVTMENHTVIGGLGTAVAEVVAEAGIGKKVTRIGLYDTYAHGASRPYLMQHYGLDAMALVQRIEQLLGEKLHITEADLAAVRFDEVHSLSKAEAL